MASKTVEQWYEYLLAEKESASTLADLTGAPANAADLFAAVTSRSKVAKWALWLWLVAVAARALESLFDIHKRDVEAAAAAAIAGTNVWLVLQAKLFEVGNGSLAVGPDRKVVYAISNPTNRIVVYAAVAREYGRAVLKVAKQAEGLPVPLTSPELVQLATYINHIQFAGTKLAVVSREADKLKVTGQVYYDGLLDVTQVEADVAAAVAAHLANLPFDAAVSLEKLTDAVQAVSGVKDLVLQFYGRPDATPMYGAVLSGPTWSPFAGYAVVDDLDLIYLVG